MLPGRPFGDEVRIREQDARGLCVGAEDAYRLARLDQQRLVGLEAFERFYDPVEALPVARGAAVAAVNDQLLGPLGDVGMQIVHQHPQRRFGEPAFCADLTAGRGSYLATVV